MHKNFIPDSMLASPDMPFRPHADTWHRKDIGHIIISLKGKKERLFAIDVNRNWRIVFEFKDGNAYVVDYEDYH